MYVGFHYRLLPTLMWIPWKADGRRQNAVSVSGRRRKRQKERERERLWAAGISGPVPMQCAETLTKAFCTSSAQPIFSRFSSTFSSLPARLSSPSTCFAAGATCPSVLSDAAASALSRLSIEDGSSGPGAGAGAGCV